jgi:hypothetical protein
MRKIAVILLMVGLAGCGGKISNGDLAKLNGYWEIHEVIMPDGEKKDYTVNQTVDYFEIKGKTGFRKKLMPRFDGKFEENGLQESFAIKAHGDVLYMNYKTDYATWQEELVSLSDSVLVVKNDNKIEYHYKRHVPFALK